MASIARGLLVMKRQRYLSGMPQCSEFVVRDAFDRLGLILQKLHHGDVRAAVLQMKVLRLGLKNWI